MAHSRHEDDNDYASTYSGYSRPRYARRHATHHSRNEKDSSHYSGFAKAALGIVFVELVAACLSGWMRKRDEQREHAQRRERKRRFEKAKARRRREEEKWERRQEERDRRDVTKWDDVEVHEVRRIGYALPDHRTRSESRAPRRIEAPPEWDDEDETWDSEQMRPQENRSRSRPAVDVP